MIDIHDLSIVYDEDIVALNHLNCHIKKDKCTFIIGKNGSGKSTFLQSLVGVVEGNGNIIIDHLELTKDSLPIIRNKVGLIFQNPDHQLFMSTLYDDLAFGLINQGLSQEEIDQRIHHISSKLHLEKYLKRSCHKLSGGQKRMAAIATVLIMDPDIILMDEPSSFLDPKSRREMIHMIKSLQKTLVIASHDLDMALDIAADVILFDDGQLIVQDNPYKVLLNQQLLETHGLELPYRYQR